MEISLTGRKALIGGASRGLGLAVANQLAACGAEVTLMARNEKKLQTALTSLPVTCGQQHNWLAVDFSDFETFSKRIDEWLQDRHVDILVNNTNGPSAGGVLEKTVSDYQQSFDLLFKNVCFLTLKIVPGMQREKFGRIINISSTTVKEPLQNLVLSNSIRSAVLSWSKSLARELAPSGITVNNILTGNFDTERLNEVNGLQAQKMGIGLEEYIGKLTREVPAGRLGDPREFGYLVAFLASQYASYITGTAIPIDGGLLRSL